jgi:hypothetical protein
MSEKRQKGLERLPDLAQDLKMQIEALCPTAIVHIASLRPNYAPDADAAIEVFNVPDEQAWDLDWETTRMASAVADENRVHIVVLVHSASDTQNITPSGWRRFWQSSKPLLCCHNRQRRTNVTREQRKGKRRRLLEVLAGKAKRMKALHRLPELKVEFDLNLDEFVARE